MPFTEADIEDAIIDTLSNLPEQRWEFIPATALPRAERDVLIESHLREALIRLNPEIAAQPDHADEVIHRLRGVFLEARSSGLVRANEAFSEWLTGQHSMPFGKNHQHVSVNLIDFKTPENNRFVVTRQLTYHHPPNPEKRFDIVLYVNGLPLVVSELKSPTRPSVSWEDGAKDFVTDYWNSVAEFFVPNLLCFASEGKTFCYAPIHAPYNLWAPWGHTEDREERPPSLEEVLRSVERMLRPEVVVELLGAFNVFSTTKQGRKVKVLARYPQYEAAKQIVERVVEGRIRKGLIWHFQGSGKSLLMVFAAQLLKVEPQLQNPTVIVVVDRTDLDTQIGSTFDAADVPNTVKAGSRVELERLLRQDTRHILITTVHKFGEAEGVLNERGNIIVLVDEAHRTQEGDLGARMRTALPNAFFFGFTGTPIARHDRNTFVLFGAEEDPGRYLNYYSYKQSIRDRATLPVRFEPRLVELRVDASAINAGFTELAETHGLYLGEQAQLSQRAGRLAHLLNAPTRLAAIADDIVKHFRERIEASGFKGMVVLYNRDAVAQMKCLLDERLPREATEVIMTLQANDLQRWRDMGIPVREEDYNRWQTLDKDDAALEKRQDEFRHPDHPLKLLLVTAKLLAGFDAPICQVMYLDKPLRDHTLLQGICRTNRTYPQKEHGLIVDYLGVFDNLARALDYDPQAIEGVVEDLKRYKAEFPQLLEHALSHFSGVDRTDTSYEGLLAAQECLNSVEKRDAFAADFSVLSRVWESLYPDPDIRVYEKDYRWLAKVYESVKPASGVGRLLWVDLGPKTIKLIHEQVQVETIREDLDELVLDADLVAKLDKTSRRRRGLRLQISIASRLRGHRAGLRFIALGERLERLKEQYEMDAISSLEWLKALIELAHEVVRAEQENGVEKAEDEEEALTRIFLECKVDKTPEVIGQIVHDIDAIVKATRFDNWQRTISGEREIQRVLRQTLLKSRLHRDTDLFNKAYAYIREHY